MFVNNLWFFCAIGAAVLWGASYALSEELIQKRGVPPSFLILVEMLVAIPVGIMLIGFLGTYKTGIASVFQNTNTALLTILMGVLFVVGSFLILYSVSLKNATITSFIEISYPLFTMLFVWLFFNKIDLNIYTALGATLIVAGVVVVLVKA